MPKKGNGMCIFVFYKRSMCLPRLHLAFSFFRWTIFLFIPFGLHYLLDGVYFTGSMASFLLPCIDIFHRNPYEYSPYFTIILFLFFVIELFFLLHPRLRTWYQLVEKEDPKTKQYQWVRQNICFLPLLEWIVLFSLLAVEFVFYLMVFVF